MSQQKNVEYYMSLPYEITLKNLPSNDGGGLIATVPLLGTSSCYAWGSTVDEALANVNDIMRDTFELCLEKGLPIPEPTDEQRLFSGKFALRMPPYLHRQIAETANAEGISINQLICNALSEFMGAQHARSFRCAAPKD